MEVGIRQDILVSVDAPSNEVQTTNNNANAYKTDNVETVKIQKLIKQYIAKFEGKHGFLSENVMIPNPTTTTTGNDLMSSPTNPFSPTSFSPQALAPPPSTPSSILKRFSWSNSSSNSHSGTKTVKWKGELQVQVDSVKINPIRVLKFKPPTEDDPGFANMAVADTTTELFSVQHVFEVKVFIKGMPRPIILEAPGIFGDADFELRTWVVKNSELIGKGLDFRGVVLHRMMEE